MSSGLDTVERFLGSAGFDRAPWLAAGFAGGIGAWFVLADAYQWLALVCLCLAATLASLTMMRPDGRHPFLRAALAAMALAIASGCATVWAKSALVGQAAIARPVVVTLDARVLGRRDEPAENRVRLWLATRDPGTGRPVRVRINLAQKDDVPGIGEGALIRLRARLMPPAPPMLPGAYDFARAAWFMGLAATGGALEPPQVLETGESGGLLDRLQLSLSRHVRGSLEGSPGALAAAFASGDRGAIDKADDAAMRDAGLTHLLSISGLHVGAVVAGVYFLALRLLALWPWLTLRVRLPIVAAGAGAFAGVFYTLLTGAEVPTVRSCLGALLMLAAVALGREPLSMRMLAVVAFLVMLLWPEAVVSPGFQMSFGAVIAILALHGSAPARAFLAPREEGWPLWLLRRVAMLLLTGVAVELALMPIGLFHFHRAGVYGALANVVAIPLTTFVSMPLIGLALLFDLAGAGAPFWWLAGQSLELLLAIARWTAGQPGAVSVLPAMGLESILLFVSGGLWLALWRGRVRLAGLVPVTIGAVSLWLLRPPDLLVSGDGRHVGIVADDGDSLLVLREGRGGYASETLAEMAGMQGESKLIADYPGARCSPDFCAIELQRGGRAWHLLLARGFDPVPERAMVAACERVDIVISPRWLPYSCRPRWLKADRTLLERTGGLAIDLENGTVTTVAQSQGQHGWWHGTVVRPRFQ